MGGEKEEEEWGHFIWEIHLRIRNEMEVAGGKYGLESSYRGFSFDWSLLLIKDGKDFACPIAGEMWGIVRQ